MAAVLSGNRNFEGRINPLVKANYLASPPLVVAYALAGTRGYRSDQRAAGRRTPTGKPVYLRDIWPTNEEVQRDRARVHRPRHVPARIRARLSRATPTGRRCRCRPAISIEWDDQSTYIKKPPYFDNMVDPETSVQDLRRHARAGAAGRFGDHRSHFAGRLDSAKTARRAAT